MCPSGYITLGKRYTVFVETSLLLRSMSLWKRFISCHMIHRFGGLPVEKARNVRHLYPGEAPI